MVGQALAFGIPVLFVQVYGVTYLSCLSQICIPVGNALTIVNCYNCFSLWLCRLMIVQGLTAKFIVYPPVVSRKLHTEIPLLTRKSDLKGQPPGQGPSWEEVQSFQPEPVSWGGNESLFQVTLPGPPGGLLFSSILVILFWFLFEEGRYLFLKSTWNHTNQTKPKQNKKLTCPACYIVRISSTLSHWGPHCLSFLGSFLGAFSGVLNLYYFTVSFCKHTFIWES